MQPMNRKELEALVAVALSGQPGFDIMDNARAVTDALWAEMVPTRAGFTDGAADMQFGNRCSGQLCRALICTDTPAPTREEDAVKLAREAVEVKRLVDAMTIPVSIIRDSIRAGGLCGAVDALARTADRILKEADDGQV